MYRGFNLTINSDFPNAQKVKDYFESYEEIRNNISKYAIDALSLDGTKIQSDWFPNVKRHVFLSHAHTDERNATYLAGWLLHHFGITTFIDSKIWGYVDVLKERIISFYGNKKLPVGFDLEKFAITHAHVMLITALNEVIDKSECFIFLNSKNSVNSKSVKDDIQVSSSWIYAELEISRTITKRNIRQVHELFLEQRSTTPQIVYDSNTAHLTSLSLNKLITWQSESKAETPEAALDELYKLCPQIRVTYPFLSNGK